MAIIKEVINSDGFSAEYWKIGMVRLDENLKEAYISVNLYYNKEHSIDNVNGFLDTYCCTSLIGNPDKTIYSTYFDDVTTYPNWKAACYEYLIKYEEFFKDATSDEPPVEEVTPI